MLGLHCWMWAFFFLCMQEEEDGGGRVGLCWWSARAGTIRFVLGGLWRKRRRGSTLEEGVGGANTSFSSFPCGSTSSSTSLLLSSASSRCCCWVTSPFALRSLEGCWSCCVCERRPLWFSSRCSLFLLTNNFTVCFFFAMPLFVLEGFFFQSLSSLETGKMVKTTALNVVFFFPPLTLSSQCKMYELKTVLRWKIRDQISYIVAFAQSYRSFSFFFS